MADREFRLLSPLSELCTLNSELFSPSVLIRVIRGQFLFLFLFEPFVLFVAIFPIRAMRARSL